jgi:hypothetical protein
VQTERGGRRARVGCRRAKPVVVQSLRCTSWRLDDRAMDNCFDLLPQHPSASVKSLLTTARYITPASHHHHALFTVMLSTFCTAFVLLDTAVYLGSRIDQSLNTLVVRWANKAVHGTIPHDHIEFLRLGRSTWGTDQSRLAVHSTKARKRAWNPDFLTSLTSPTFMPILHRHL